MKTVFVVYRRMRIDWSSYEAFEVYEYLVYAQNRVINLTREAASTDKPEYDEYWIKEVPFNPSFI